jgi:16S rRNA (adenine1518-N6/adenine1519-N6)-dimethyltransferase
VEIAFAIPRSVFIPVPNVDSVMVSLVRHPTVPPATEVAALCSLIDTAFAQRRKTLANTLTSVAPRDVLAGCAMRAGIALDARAEALGTEDFHRLLQELRAVGVVVATGTRYGSTPKQGSP